MRVGLLPIKGDYGSYSVAGEIRELSDIFALDDLEPENKFDFILIIDKQGTLPYALELVEQNFPNGFGPETKIIHFVRSMFSKQNDKCYEYFPVRELFYKDGILDWIYSRHEFRELGLPIRSLV